MIATVNKFKITLCIKQKFSKHRHACIKVWPNCSQSRTGRIWLKVWRFVEPVRTSRTLKVLRKNSVWQKFATPLLTTRQNEKRTWEFLRNFWVLLVCDTKCNRIVHYVRRYSQGKEKQKHTSNLTLSVNKVACTCLQVHWGELGCAWAQPELEYDALARLHNEIMMRPSTFAHSKHMHIWETGPEAGLSNVHMSNTLQATMTTMLSKLSLLPLYEVISKQSIKIWLPIGLLRCPGRVAKKRAR